MTQSPQPKNIDWLPIEYRNGSPLCDLQQLRTVNNALGPQTTTIRGRPRTWRWIPAFRLRAHALRRTQTRRSSRSERRPGRGDERAHRRARPRAAAQRGAQHRGDERVVKGAKARNVNSSWPALCVGVRKHAVLRTAMPFTSYRIAPM